MAHEERADEEAAGVDIDRHIDDAYFLIDGAEARIERCVHCSRVPCSCAEDYDARRAHLSAIRWGNR